MFIALRFLKMEKDFFLTAINIRHFFDINFLKAVIFLIFDYYMQFFFLFQDNYLLFYFEINFLKATIFPFGALWEFFLQNIEDTRLVTKVAAATLVLCCISVICIMLQLNN